MAGIDDPDVLAIKMTLYRVGKRSPIVDALMAAARKNKDVTVIVELRARFDEEANIGLAQKLSEAGAKNCIWCCELQMPCQDINACETRAI